MTTSSLLKFSTLLIGASLLGACTKPEQPSANNSTEESAQEFVLNYEKITLDNGLEVVLHQDKSDPVTAVALTFHVGSAREIEGRTGFAHLFEHLLFLESENLGKGGLDKMSSRIGGSGANGSTSRDRTNYFQTVPNDALEKMIWAEADKLGFFINTVTDTVLSKEKQVVKNEKRQSYDNRPYGHANYVVDKNLYPEDHPYNWQVIGSLEDLQNATLQDVKDFYKKWYVPNNATLVIAGDFDAEQAKAWVHKYFDEIPRGEEIKPLVDKPAVLTDSKLRMYEDNFAQLPELRMVWPGVDLFHHDAYALDVLSQYLSEGKVAPLNKILIDDKALTSNVSMYSSNSEIAGEISIITRAYPGTDLDDVKLAIEEAFTEFEENGISDEDLARIKAGIEASFYNRLSSVLGKAFHLAQYNIFADDPGYVNEEIKKFLAVSKDDVMLVYRQYIKDKAFVSTSFVPKGQGELALEGASPANVVEEAIVVNAEGETFELPADTEYVKTPSSFDRSIEPAYGETPTPPVPEVWHTELSNGLTLYGIENDELPLVEFTLQIDGGLSAESMETAGVANLLAMVLEKGTATKTPEELESALAMLGASIDISANRESIVVYGNTLSKNYQSTLALVKEMLLSPRWDEKEFTLAKQSTLSTIAQQKANPNNIADNAFAALLYGEDHIFSLNPMGNESTLSNISMDDLKAYYAKYIAPNLTHVHVVGAVSSETVIETMKGWVEGWPKKAVSLPELKVANTPETSKVYFYDVPGAKQSVLRFGYLAMAETDEDFYPATVMNYKLGGGGFASRLTQSLREGKGYTYGIRSAFSGSDIPGPFIIGSGVRTNVTFESAALVKDILTLYPDTFSEEDLVNTKSFFLKSAARQFETANAKLSLLQKMSRYGWQADIVQTRQNIVQNITIEDIQQLATTYANPDKMIWLVVGDAKTQLPRLAELGFGEPILLNADNASMSSSKE